MITASMPEMACRSGCAACCIAPSISSAIPGMPQGKPAGVRCVQLDDAQRCRLFGMPERPAVCLSLKPGPAMCGENKDQAMQRLAWLEQQTMPGRE
jgi:Fe-S-cluster containining protein